MTTRTKARRPRAALAIMLAGIATTATVCVGCQGHTAATPSALAAGLGASTSGPTGTATATASPSAATSPSGAAASLSAGAKSRAGSPTPAAPSPSPALPLAGKVVAIDPGHDGGNGDHASEINALVPQGFGQYKACDTTGAEAPDGYTEHQFNFQVALLVESMLQQQGVKVVMTRTNDTGVGPCVNVRAAIGNDAHANAAISIHADGGPVSGHGYQLLEAEQSLGGATVQAASHQLATALHSAFDRESGLTTSTYVGTNGYDPRDDLAGLNLSTVPKILVECGNMQNAGDLALEESSTGRAHIAKAIADGIIAYLTANS